MSSQVLQFELRNLLCGFQFDLNPGAQYLSNATEIPFEGASNRADLPVLLKRIDSLPLQQNGIMSCVRHDQLPTMDHTARFGARCRFPL